MIKYEDLQATLQALLQVLVLLCLINKNLHHAGGKYNMLGRIASAFLKENHQHKKQGFDRLLRHPELLCFAYVLQYGTGEAANKRT